VVGQTAQIEKSCHRGNGRQHPVTEDNEAILRLGDGILSRIDDLQLHNRIALHMVTRSRMTQSMHDFPSLRLCRSISCPFQLCHNSTVPRPRLRKSHTSLRGKGEDRHVQSKPEYRYIADRSSSLSRNRFRYISWQLMIFHRSSSEQAPSASMGGTVRHGRLDRIDGGTFWGTSALFRMSDHRNEAAVHQ